MEIFIAGLLSAPTVTSATAMAPFILAPIAFFMAVCLGITWLAR